jgi:hypothetical protein
LIGIPSRRVSAARRPPARCLRAGATNRSPEALGARRLRGAIEWQPAVSTAYPIAAVVATALEPPEKEAESLRCLACVEVGVMHTKCRIITYGRVSHLPMLVALR